MYVLLDKLLSEESSLELLYGIAQLRHELLKWSRCMLDTKFEAPTSGDKQ
jgi:hypothetical protein